MVSGVTFELHFGVDTIAVGCITTKTKELSALIVENSLTVRVCRCVTASYAVGLSQFADQRIMDTFSVNSYIPERWGVAVKVFQ